MVYTAYRYSNVTICGYQTRGRTDEFLASASAYAVDTNGLRATHDEPGWQTRRHLTCLREWPPDEYLLQPPLSIDLYTTQHQSMSAFGFRGLRFRALLAVCFFAILFFQSGEALGLLLLFAC